MSGIETVLSALDERGLSHRFTGGQHKCQCPCPNHPDNEPSLAVKEADDLVLFFCHVGCAADDIIAALGLKWKDVNPSRARHDDQRQAGENVHYYYTDLDGKVLYRKVRTPSKGFWIEHPVGAGWAKGKGVVEPELYNLTGLVKGVRDKQRILIPEGEKDADAAIALGLVATCNFDGRRKRDSARSGVTPTIVTSRAPTSPSWLTATRPASPTPARSVPL
jgi:hypothetical protein